MIDVFQHHSPFNNRGSLAKVKLLLLINFCSRISHSFDSTAKLKNTVVPHVLSDDDFNSKALNSLSLNFEL